MKKALAVGILITVISMTPPPAFAVGSGGFENASFSAKSLAMADAVTATPDEPAAISYNPAGIADLPGVQVQGNASFISMFTWKKNDGVNGNTRSSGTISTVPTGYITINPGKVFNDNLAFGVGMDSPFGLMNKYKGGDASVHYTGWRNYLKMYSIKPVVAYKFTDKISIGGGPVWYRVDDFGGIQGYPNDLITRTFAGFSTPDGQIRLNTSGNKWGWQLGTLIKINKKHRLGYYFRSPVTLKLSGLAKVENSNIPGFLGGLGLRNFETGVHTKLNLPMNMTWAYAYQPNEKTHYELDFTWSHWSTNERLYFVTDPSGNAADDAILNNIRSADKDWRDGFGLQLGVSHKLTKKLTLLGGSFFYWTPIPNSSFSPSVPDANHLSLSIGLSYAINKYLTADAMYSNAFYFRRRINNSLGESAVLSNSSVDGTYTSYMQHFAFSLTAHWDDIFPRSFGNKTTEPEAPSIDMKAGN
jgi:long-chain fatty acid transport protein